MAAYAAQAASSQKTDSVFEELKKAGKIVLAVPAAVLILVVIEVAVLPAFGLQLIVLVAMGLALVLAPPYADRAYGKIRELQSDPDSNRPRHWLEGFFRTPADVYHVNDVQAVGVVVLGMAAIGLLSAGLIFLEWSHILPEGTGWFGLLPYLYVVFIPVIAGMRLTSAGNWPFIWVFTAALVVGWWAIQWLFGMESYAILFKYLPDALSWLVTLFVIVPTIAFATCLVVLRSQIHKERYDEKDEDGDPVVWLERLQDRVVLTAPVVVLGMMALSIAVWALAPNIPLNNAGVGHTRNDLGWVFIRQAAYVLGLIWTYVYLIKPVAEAKRDMLYAAAKAPPKQQEAAH